MAPAEPHRPIVLVVMGVSGSGKSTVGTRLARRLGWRFADGDDFHSPAHVLKMRTGHALDDADRAPWLARVREWIDACLDAGESGVVVCSALKRAYRDALVGGRDAVRIVFLDGSRDIVAERLAARRDHFMPGLLLDSQFAALERPSPDENAIVVSIGSAPDAIAASIASAFGSTEAGCPSR